jgi:hypothetical protein
VGGGGGGGRGNGVNATYTHTHTHTHTQPGNAPGLDDVVVDVAVLQHNRTVLFHIALKAFCPRSCMTKGIKH